MGNNRIKILFQTYFLYGAILLVCSVLTSCFPQKPATNAFNILWITSEDMNPYLGAYGDSLAITPHLDQLAEEGVLFTHAFATAPVCSPSRSCLITGVYATSLGTQHLRSEVQIPSSIIPFPKLLREAGYYCTNNKKEDYNFQDSTIWDESSASAHWRNRPEGKPFFSVFNFETTHQSRIFGSDSAFYERFGKRLTEAERHQPNQMLPPPYHFDSPKIRKMWARYYDLVTVMDKQVGELLSQLEADGLTDNTVIFYYADHGTGMPRGKRAAYDSGLKVPLIIKAPESLLQEWGLHPGTPQDALVSFVDFAPTLLSILDLPIPDYMQGIPFLGSHKQTQPYVFGHSDRVDEAFELTRTVRGPRFRYVRNFYPHLPLIQPNFYTDQSEIMQELYHIKKQAELTPAQAHMWAPFRPVEELYDTKKDPFETKNLARDSSYQEVLKEMRTAQQSWALKTYDSGLLPEPLMYKLSEGNTLYETLRDTLLFPQEQILSIANRMLEPHYSPELLYDHLQALHPALRYWAVIALHNLDTTPDKITPYLEPLLKDPVPVVSLSAAQALCERGVCTSSFSLMLNQLRETEGINRVFAARTFQFLYEKADSEILSSVRSTMQGSCPEPNHLNYYTRYFCWALEESFNSHGIPVSPISFP